MKVTAAEITSSETTFGMYTTHYITLRTAADMALFERFRVRLERREARRRRRKPHVKGTADVTVNPKRGV